MEIPAQEHWKVSEQRLLLDHRLERDQHDADGEHRAHRKHHASRRRVDRAELAPRPRRQPRCTQAASSCQRTPLRLATSSYSGSARLRGALAVVTNAAVTACGIFGAYRVVVEVPAAAGEVAGCRARVAAPAYSTPT